jgi:hypothetical protein
MEKSAIKIGLSGAHSTGKTTFLNELEIILKKNKYSVFRVDEIAVLAKNKGFSILREHDWESTFWIVVQGISAELEAARKADVVLVDRAVPDALGYLRAALITRNTTLPKWQVDILEPLIKNYSITYNFLIKTKIDVTIPIENDNRRDTDPIFRNLVDNKIDEVFSELSIPFWYLSTNNKQLILKKIIAKITEKL